MSDERLSMMIAIIKLQLVANKAGFTGKHPSWIDEPVKIKQPDK